MQVNGPNHRPLGFQNVEGNKNKSYAHIYVNVHIHRFTDLDTRARIIKGHCQRFRMRERETERAHEMQKKCMQHYCLRVEVTQTKKNSHEPQTF